MDSRKKIAYDMLVEQVSLKSVRIDTVVSVIHCTSLRLGLSHTIV